MKITVADYRTWLEPHKTLVALFDVYLLDLGIRINNCSFHSAGNARWVNSPARKLFRKDGSASWVPFVSFIHPETDQRFKWGLEQALLEYLRSESEESHD